MRSLVVPLLNPLPNSFAYFIKVLGMFFYLSCWHNCVLHITWNTLLYFQCKRSIQHSMWMKLSTADLGLADLVVAYSCAAPWAPGRKMAPSWAWQINGHSVDCSWLVKKDLVEYIWRSHGGDELRYGGRNHEVLKFGLRCVLDIAMDAVWCTMTKLYSYLWTDWCTPHWTQPYTWSRHTIQLVGSTIYINICWYTYVSIASGQEGACSQTMNISETNTSKFMQRTILIWQLRYSPALWLHCKDWGDQ